jgi:hypothetical protein
MTHVSHDLYTEDDFSDEEIDSKKTLAVQVVEYGLSICKKCGKGESELNQPCRMSKPKHERKVDRVKRVPVHDREMKKIKEVLGDDPDQ